MIIMNLNAKVRRIKMHASYDTANTDHDIALIEMDRPVKFTRGVKPVCLAEEKASFVGEHVNLKCFWYTCT